jgi:multiple sugar transport system permease protein
VSTALSSAPAPPETGAQGRGRRAKGAADGRRELIRTRRLFLVPLTLVLGLLTVVPFVYSLVISLTDKSSSGSTSFIGIDNYIDLLTDDEWWDAARVTAIFTFSVVAIEFIVAMVVAVALHRITRGAPLLRALFLLPMAMAPVAALFNWRLMLNASSGVINYLLGAVGLPQPDWTGQSTTALTTLVMVDVWQWTPFILVILVGGLSAVPDDVYEAAAVDGAGAWQTFRHITLPMLKPFILVALLFRTIDALKTFDSIQILTGGGPGSSTTTLNFYAFREGISFLNFGRSAAAATLLLILAIGLSRLLLHWLKEEEAVS